MATPHQCPVCLGNGQVSAGFYNQVTGVWSGTTTAFETCRSCGGSGVVWEPVFDLPNLFKRTPELRDR